MRRGVGSRTPKAKPPPTSKSIHPQAPYLGVGRRGGLLGAGLGRPIRNVSLELGRRDEPPPPLQDEPVRPPVQGDPFVCPPKQLSWRHPDRASGAEEGEDEGDEQGGPRRGQGGKMGQGHFCRRDRRRVSIRWCGRPLSSRQKQGLMGKSWNNDCVSQGLGLSNARARDGLAGSDTHTAAREASRRHR